MKRFTPTLRVKYVNMISYSSEIAFFFDSINVTSGNKLQSIRVADILASWQLVEYFLELILVNEVSSWNSFCRVFSKYIHFFSWMDYLHTNNIILFIKTYDMVGFIWLDLISFMNVCKSESCIFKIYLRMKLR